MTARQIIEEIAAMPREDWIKIQNGIADLIVSESSPEEIAEIQSALAEADEEFRAGKGLDLDQVRSKFGLK